MKSIECTTQAELDAVPAGTLAIVRKGYFVARDSATVEAWGSATVRAGGSATVRAWGSATVRAGGSATVKAWGSATVRAGGSATVRAWGSATVRAWDSATVEAWGSATVEAWDSATVRAGGSATVEAWDSATVRAGGSATVKAWGSATVKAWGSATVEAWDSATVRAGGSATVKAWGSATVEAGGSATVEAGGSATVHSTSSVVPIQTKGKNVTVTGNGIVIPIDMPADAEGWCERQGVTVDDDTAVLYKVVGPDWKSGWGMAYEPGTTPVAPDWDPGPECGSGLHFVGQAFLTHEWDHWNGEGHIVACRVQLDEIVVHPDGQYPNKVKAPRVLEVWEVTSDGMPVEAKESTDA